MTRPRILIVEDELVVGLDLQHRLTEMGYEVVAVLPSGEEALQEVPASAPDLVLMDIKLAGDMDGVEAALRIREQVDVPIVFVTAFADEATTRRVKAVAPYGYVVKPFQREALRAVIESALTRHEMEIRLQESERSLRRANESERTLRRRLEGIDRAGVAVSTALATLGTDVRPFFQVVVEEARSLANADYAALGVVAESGRPFEPWVFAGVDDETAKAIGRFPRPVGLLGEVIRADKPIRLKNLREHAASVGLPAHHPQMSSFLGIPIHYRGQSRGNLYLANKRGAEEFTDEDEAAIKMLADRVGAALEIARLHQLETRQRSRLEFLAKAGTTLAESLDFDKTLAALADLIVPSVGDMCTVELNEDGGPLRKVLVRHVDGAKQSMLESLLGPQGRAPIPEPRSEVLRLGKAQILEDVTDEYLERVGVDPKQREILRELSVRSSIAAPLVIRGQTIGVLEVATVGSRRLGEEDLHFVQEIAHVATLAIQNARYHRATERSEKEQRFLADLGAALASSLNYWQTLETIAEIAVRNIADACILDLVEGAGKLRRLEVAHANPAKAKLCAALEQIQLEGPPAHLAASVLETQQPALISDVTDAYLQSVAQSEQHLRLLRELEPRSLMGLPLLVRGRLLGCLTLISSQPARRYGPADLAFAEQAAHRIALAVDNTTLYEMAQRAIRARDDVLGIVAHDLRNPLNSILLQSEVLRHQREAEGRAQKPVELICRSANRMNRLIQELLDVARLDAGQFAVDPDRLSPADVALEAVDAHKPAAAESSLELNVELASELPEIWGDRDRLAQVLDNLIGNALKFAGSGGTITLGAAPQDAEVLFWVADTGSGIPAADVPHLFDRFWQASKGDRRGAGLGLPIVKGIVEAHGGRVWVESMPERGSTFFFTIPVAARVQSERADAVRHAP